MGQGLGPCGAGLRGFKSRPSHSNPLRPISCSVRALNPRPPARAARPLRRINATPPSAMTTTPIKVHRKPRVQIPALAFLDVSCEGWDLRVGGGWLKSVLGRTSVTNDGMSTTSALRSILGRANGVSYTGSNPAPRTLTLYDQYRARSGIRTLGRPPASSDQCHPTLCDDDDSNQCSSQTPGQIPSLGVGCQTDPTPDDDRREVIPHN